MDKPLDTIRLLVMAVFLLAGAVYAVSLSSLGGGAECLAEYVRSQWDYQRLDEERRLLDRSCAAKLDILADAIEGRLRLPEAAAALRAENEARPAHLRPGIFPFPGMSMEESYMRHVLFRAGVILADDSRRDEILKRMDAELQARLYILAGS
jgi:hypothetical protein